MEYLDGKVDSHKSHPVRRAIAALNGIAHETGCAVLVLFHLNKGASTDPLLRHEGSAAFTQIVRGALMLGHDPDGPEGDTGDQRVLAVTSSNLAHIAPALAYRIDTAHVPTTDGDMITTARMVEIGESSATGSDLLAVGDGDQSPRDEAEEFLRSELADGPRPAKEVKATARDADISDKTLRTARERLGIKPSKSGFGGGWVWALPPSGATKVPADKDAASDDNGGHLRENPLTERDYDGSGGSPSPEGAHSDTGASSGTEDAFDTVRPPGGDGRIADCLRVLKAGGDPSDLYTSDEVRLARLCMNGDER